MDCSERGDIVLDAFLGGGTTLIAAERTGRHCYALELEPIDVDTIFRRWQALTGVQAKHAFTSEKLDELISEKEGIKVH